MISLFCFILPILLWVLTFPLKLAINKLQDSLFKENGSRHSLLSRLEDWADSDDKFQAEKDLAKVGQASAKVGKATVKAGYTATKVGLKTAYNTGKFIAKAPKRAVKAVRTTKRVVKFSVQATRKAIELTIRAIKWLIMLIKLIITSLLALGVVGIVILVIIAVALIVCVVVIIINASITQVQAETVSGGTVSGGFSGYDYSKIDWSQDFSAKLDEIQGTYGALNRNWVELSIINMNTNQQCEESRLTLDGFMLAFKVIESEAQSVMGGDESAHPMTANSSVMSSGGGASDDGPYQIEDSSLGAWIKGNSPLYSIGQQASRRYYPDILYGIPQTFNQDVVKAYSAESPPDIVAQAFSELGEELTQEKYEIIMCALLPLKFADGNIFDGGYPGGGMTKASNIQRNKNICQLLILFMQKYGWGRSEVKVELARSMNSARGGESWSSESVYPYDDMQTGIMGIAGQGNFGSLVQKTGNFGVLDENGSAVDGTFYNYLLQGAPESVRNEILSSGGGMDLCSNTIWYKRCIYSMSVYLNSGYILDMAVERLGLRDQVVTGDSSGSAVSGDYSNKIWQIAERVSKGHPTYSWDGRNQQNIFDCSSLVHRALIECGITAFDRNLEDYSGYKSEDAISGNCLNTKGEMDWVRANQPQAIISEGSVDPSQMEIGDVCVNNNHTIFFMGQAKSGDGYLKFHASSGNPSQFSCSDNPELTGTKYGVGWGRYSDQGWLMVYRPSLFK